MSTIVTRAGKGSPLTNTEVDSNFTNLNDDKLEFDGSVLAEKIAFDTTAALTPTTGEMVWDADTGTVDIGLNGASSPFFSVGEDQFYRVINQSGTTITKGTLVMAAGTVGNSGVIKVLPWNGSQPSKTIMGLTLADIPTEDDPTETGLGYVLAFGKLRGIQTNGGNYSESWVNGDILFAGASGGLTKTLPAAPSAKATVAIVISAHASNGTLFVRVTQGSNLAEDELVQLSGLANADVLSYDATDGRFENKTLADAGIYASSNPAGYTTNTGTVTSVGGTGTVNGITLSGTVTSSGNLTLGGTLSNVSLTTQVTGTLPVANGGSGATTLTGVLKGNGTSAFTAGNVNLTSEVTGTLPVANGGTGATTLTANNVILGNGTSAVNFVAPGTAGNVLTSNGTTWTSGPAPVVAGALQAVATGTLSDGTKVIINTDGTVSAVGFTQGAPLFSSEVVYESVGRSGPRVSVYDAASGKVVVSVIDKVWVGTVSGTSISFGSPVTVPGGNLNIQSAAYDANAQKIVFILIQSSPSYGYAIVGTVSGTSISFGAASGFNIASTMFAKSAVYDSVNQNVIFSWSGASVNKTYVQTANVSGTSVSFGTAVEIFNANVAASLTYDTNAQKVVATYAGSSDYGTARVCTVSGTSITLGTAVVYNSATSFQSTIVYDAASQKVVIGFRDSGNSSYATAIVGTVSGTSISFGSKVALNTADTSFSSSVYDSSLNKFVLVGSTNNNGFAFIGSVSGTTPNVSYTEIFNAGSTFTNSVSFDSLNNKVVFAYEDTSNSSYSTSRVLETAQLTSNLTAENFIGISNASYANGATATIQTVGSVDDAQSGLTAGQAYYVQEDGSLSTTPGSPSVFAGTAVSASKIIIKG
jgi:hypothetical protein